VSGPSISSLSVTSGHQGDPPFDVLITGSQLTGASSVNISPAGITASPPSVSPDGNSLHTTFTIASSAPVQSYNVTVSVPSGATNALPFQVLTAGSPQILTLAPSTLFIGDSPPPTVKIQGSGFTQVNAVAFQDPIGISTSNLVHLDDTAITVTVTVSQGAHTGTNHVSVSTGSLTSNTVAVTIAALPQVGSPVLTQVSPAVFLTTPDNVTLTLTGSNFYQSSVIYLDGSSYLPDSVSADGTTMMFTASVFSNAGYHTVFVVNPQAPPLQSQSKSLVVEVDNPRPDLRFVSGTTPSPLVTGLASATVSLNAFSLVTPGNGGALTGTTAFVDGAADANRRSFNQSGGLSVGLVASDLTTAGTNILTIKLKNPAPGGGFSATSVPVTVKNPTPSIASLAPDALPQNAAMPQSLVINGTNFMSTSTVQVGGSARTPQSPHSSTQMTVPLQGSNVSSTGSVAVTVSNPAPVAGSGTKNLTINAAGTCSWVSTFSGDGNYAYLDGIGTGAEWASPTGAVVAKDPTSGKMCLFVCDTDDQRIRMIYLDTGQSVTIAGNGVAGLDSGGVPATAHKLNGPRGICAYNDSSGNLKVLYISDFYNNMIRELIPEQPYSNSNWLLGQSCGNGIAGWADGEFDVAEFNQPKGIFFGWDSNVYVADSVNGAIRKIDLSGNSSSILHNTAWHTLGVTGSQSRNVIYLSERNTQAVYSFTTAGASQTQLAAGFANPWELCFANNTTDGDVLYIPSMVGCQIKKLVLSNNTLSTYAGSGSYGSQDGDCALATFAYPKAVCNGIAGEIYVTDMYNNRIRKIQ
jgi:hypothetical protein